MTPDDLAEMNRLCLAIQKEQDSKKFDILVTTLNQLLERQERRLGPRDQSNQIGNQPQERNHNAEAKNTFRAGSTGARKEDCRA
jgi:hypothetical protein